MTAPGITGPYGTSTKNKTKQLHTDTTTKAFHFLFYSVTHEKGRTRPVESSQAASFPATCGHAPLTVQFCVLHSIFFFFLAKPQIMLIVYSKATAANSY